MSRKLPAIEVLEERQKVKLIKKCNWCNEWYTIRFNKAELSQPLNPSTIKNTTVSCPNCNANCGSYAYNKFTVKKSTDIEIDSVINKQVP